MHSFSGLTKIKQKTHLQTSKKKTKTHAKRTRSNHAEQNFC